MLTCFSAADQALTATSAAGAPSSLSATPSELTAGAGAGAGSAWYCFFLTAAGAWTAG